MNFNNRTRQLGDKLKKVRFKLFKDSNQRQPSKLAFTSKKLHKLKHSGMHCKGKMSNFKGG